MTGWMSEINARHIPEDELHAYLDQALSRSQCVEIECHLAECRTCRADRDRAAAVRDRTTALLADVAPQRIAAAPPFEQLVASHRARVSARVVSLARLRRVALLAAGLMAAVGAGWWSRGVIPRSAPTTASALVAAEAPAPERTLVALSPVTTASPETRGSASGAAKANPVLRTRVRTESPLVAVVGQRPEPMVQFTTSAEEDAAPLDGLWQTVDLAQAAAETGGNVPRIDGLAIIDIQLQHGQGDERPIVVVAQRHPSGRIVQTIEGPMDRVQDLVARHRAQHAGLGASQPDLTPPDYLSDGAVNARRGLRILTVTGQLPADSLNLLARSIALRE